MKNIISFFLCISLLSNLTISNFNYNFATNINNINSTYDYQVDDDNYQNENNLFEKNNISNNQNDGEYDIINGIDIMSDKINNSELSKEQIDVDKAVDNKLVDNTNEINNDLFEDTNDENNLYDDTIKTKEVDNINISTISNIDFCEEDENNLNDIDISISTSSEIKDNRFISISTKSQILFKSNISTYSQTISTISELLNNIYNDYQGVFSYSDGVIYLEKNITLTNSINFFYGKYIFDLKNHTLNGPEDEPAIKIYNSDVVIKDSKLNGIIKGNSDYAITIEDSNITFGVCNILSNECSSAIYLKNSNMNIVGANIYGGDAKNNKSKLAENGMPAICCDFTNNDYKINAVYGKIKGGKGGIGKKTNSKGIGGNALLINNKIDKRIINNLPLLNGVMGDFGSGNGGDALVINGNFSNDNIVINNSKILQGGDAGKKYKLSFGSKDNLSNSLNNSSFEKKWVTEDKYLTSLKNQATTGLCYTFTHMAMAETYMLKYFANFCKKHLFNGEFDLSEIMTAYGFRNNPPDPLDNASKSSETIEFFGTDGSYEKINFWDLGASVLTFALYASQFRGIQSEKVAPFSDGLEDFFGLPFFDGEKYNTNDLDKQLNNDIVHLLNLKLYEESEVETDRAEYIDRVKNIVKKNGSCGIGIEYDTECFGYDIDDTHNTMTIMPNCDLFNIVRGSSGGHAMTIIGWDDDFDKNNFKCQQYYNEYLKNKDQSINDFLKEVKDFEERTGLDLAYDYEYIKYCFENLQVPGNGAFLCKNSHNKYTWVSYYNELDTIKNYEAEFIPNYIYDNMYYYDSGTYEEEIKNMKSVAAIYTSKQPKEKIMALSVTVLNDVKNVQFEVGKADGDSINDINDLNIYKNELSILDETKITKKQDIFYGTNIIKLSPDEYIDLKKNDKFIVKMTVSDENDIIVMPISKPDEIITKYKNGEEHRTYKTTPSGNTYYKDDISNDLYTKYVDGDCRLRVITNNYNKKHYFDKFMADKIPVEKSDINKIIFYEDNIGINNNILELDDYGMYCYLTNDNELTICVPNGDSIVFEEDKNYIFKEFTNLNKIDNLDIVDFEDINNYETEQQTTEIEQTTIETKTTNSSEQQTETTIAPEEKTYIYVSFLPNGGTGSMPNQQIEINIKTKLNYNKFKKRGYYLDYWIDENGRKINDGAYVTFVNDTVLKAHWHKNSSSNNNGGGSGGSSGGAGGGSISNTGQLNNNNMNNTNNTNTNNNSSNNKIVISNNKYQIFDSNNNWYKDLTTNNWKMNLIVNNQNVEAKNCFIDELAYVNNQLVTNTYAFDQNGNMCTGWIYTNDNNWYFAENYDKNTYGIIVKNVFKNIDGIVYYFGADGKLLMTF